MNLLAKAAFFFHFLVVSDSLALHFLVQSDSLVAHLFSERLGHPPVSSGGPLLSSAWGRVLVPSCDDLSAPWASLVQLDEPG